MVKLWQFEQNRTKASEVIEHLEMSPKDTDVPA